MRQFVRLAQGAYSFVRLVRDMNRTDEVFAVLAKLNVPERMRPVVEEFKKHPDTARAIAERPLVGKVDMPALRRLAPGTLGHAFAAHLDANGLDPNFYPDVEIKEDTDYMRRHLFETHDVWHVITGFDTSVAGEIGLQAFYLAQLPLGPLPPVLIAAGMLNTALFAQRENAERTAAVARGFTLGRQARPLFGAPWAELWEQPLSTIRRQYNIPEPPEARRATAS